MQHRCARHIGAALAEVLEKDALYAFPVNIVFQEPVLAVARVTVLEL